MKPPEFDYIRPKTLDEAVAALSVMEWARGSLPEDSLWSPCSIFALLP